MKKIIYILTFMIIMIISTSTVVLGENYNDVINDQVKEGSTKTYVLDNYAYEITIEDITMADDLEDRKAKISVNAEDSGLLSTGETYALESNKVFESITLRLNGISKINQEYFAIFELKHNKKSIPYFGMGIDESAAISDITTFTDIAFKLEDNGYERPNSTFTFNEVNARELEYKITLAFYSNEAIIIKGESLTQKQILFSDELQKVLTDLNLNYRTVSSKDVTSEMLIDLFKIKYVEATKDARTTEEKTTEEDIKEVKEKLCMIPLCEPVYESGEYYKDGCPIYKCGEPEDTNDIGNDKKPIDNTDRDNTNIEEIEEIPEQNTWNKFLDWLTNIFQ